MKKRDRSFIKAAIILGLSFFIAIFLVRPVGVSTQFSVLSGIVYNSVDKDIIAVDKNTESGYSSKVDYYNRNNGALAKDIREPINYEFVFVLAIPLGSFIGYLLLKNKNKNEKNVCQNCRDNRNSFKEYILSFIGGFILLFGARMADGCTSGHMMSGMMQGSVSGYVFAAFVFASSIPIAILIKKIRA